MIRDSSVIQGYICIHTLHTLTHTHTYAHINTLCKARYCSQCLFRVGLALDAYMMPVEDGIETSVEQPLLFINMWTWQWPKNVVKIKALVDSKKMADSKTQNQVLHHMM